MKKSILLILMISFFVPYGFAGNKTRIKKNKPIIVLSFDDAVISDYTNIAPLLKKYKFGGTFFVCEFPRKDPADSVKYMSWKQISQLNKMGFEIGNHTHTHKHVNSMHRDQMEDEISYIEKKCKEYDIPKPVSFAYPGYDTDSLALVVLKEMGYKYARIGGSRVYNPKEDNSLLIPSFSTSGEDDKAKERVMNVLENAKAGNIIVFTIHGVPDTVHPWVNTAPELFEMYMKYMHDNHFNVIAMRDLEKVIRKIGY